MVDKFNCIIFVVENWKNLVFKLEILNDEIWKFEGMMREFERISLIIEVMKWVVVKFFDICLIDVVRVLDKI